MHLDHIDLPDSLRSRLRHLAQGARLAHLWIFFSPSEEGATAVARAFLLDWLGAESPERHPDLHELRAVGKAGLHSIDTVRRLLDELALTPYGGRGRAVLIEAADRMAPAAANALLKTLEEPPPRTTIVLTTAVPHRLLPTIVSRAHTVRIPARSQAVDGDTMAPLLALMQRQQPPSYADLHKACGAIAESLEGEEAALSKQLAGGQEQEVEGDLTIWRHTRSKRILEDAYMLLRESQVPDPRLLVQAMAGIDSGLDLATMLLWLLSTIVVEHKG